MKKYVLLLIVLISFGCVYYNTFFNAKKIYEEANKIPLSKGKPTPTAKSKYNQAIKKCGIVITDYKNSKYVDDAIFMLGKIFYLKGINYTQAIEKFNDLITYYPDSPFAPEAYIYQAKCKFKQHNDEEGFSILDEFILNEKYKDHHPEAILAITEEYLKQDNYIQAEKYLNQLISNYPKSKERSKSYLLLGQTYQKAKDYEKSNQILDKLLTFKEKKEIKFQARYYVCNNELLLGNYEKSVKFAQKLIKDQVKEDDIARTKILLARSFVGLKNYKKAEKNFTFVINTKKKSDLSAETSYYLAEMYFTELHDYENAIKYYNKVKIESRTSPFVEKSVLRSAVSSQILQYHKSNITLADANIIEQQFKLAEYYINELNYPDSALVIYNQIINGDTVFVNKIDSLNVIIDKKKTAFFQELPKDYTQNDTIMVISEKIQNDTIFTDSTRTFLRELAQNISNKENDISQITANLELYRDKYKPFAYFTELWVYKKLKNDETKAREVFSILGQNYPDNRYYYAAKSFLNGEEVKFLTPLEEENLNKYDHAIAIMENNPQESIRILSDFGHDTQSPYYFMSLYALGYINYFVLSDTTNAKTYFNEMIDAKKPDNQILLKLSKYYDGENFKTADELEYNKKKAEDLKQKEESKEESKDENGGKTEEIKSLNPSSDPIDKEKDSLPPESPKKHK